MGSHPETPRRWWMTRQMARAANLDGGGVYWKSDVYGRNGVAISTLRVRASGVTSGAEKEGQEPQCDDDVMKGVAIVKQSLQAQCRRPRNVTRGASSRLSL